MYTPQLVYYFMSTYTHVYTCTYNNAVYVIDRALSCAILRWKRTKCSGSPFLRGKRLRSGIILRETAPALTQQVSARAVAAPDADAGPAVVPGSIKERSGVRKRSVRQQQQSGRINTFDPVPMAFFLQSIDCAELSRSTVSK
jgi:hypothetical protein